MKNASIYSASPTKLTGARLRMIAEIVAIETDVRFLKKPSWFEIEAHGRSLRLNVMPISQIPGHVLGLKRYAEVQLRDDPIQDLKEVTSYIGAITQVYGLVTEQEFDFESPIWGLLKEIARRIDGVIFVCDSLVDPEDCVIFGPLGGSG